MKCQFCFVKWFEMRHQLDYYRCILIRPPQIRFQIIFCITCNATHNNDVKSRVAEVHQSS